MPSFDELNAEWERIQETLPGRLWLRMRRALSWLDRAEREREQDHNAAFIFYWIAFNAAYGKAVSRDPTSTARDQFAGYFRTILSLDAHNTVYDAIWETYSGPIRLLLENRYVYHPFWEHHAGRGYDNWKYTFEQSGRQVNKALAGRDTHFILSTLFDRLYVLRNQLMHGGATWRGPVGERPSGLPRSSQPSHDDATWRNIAPRVQIPDGARIMADLVPIFVGLMMSHPDVDWGPMEYPVVP